MVQAKIHTFEIMYQFVTKQIAPMYMNPVHSDNLCCVDNVVMVQRFNMAVQIPHKCWKV